jgi:hypothetical protein
MSIAAAIKSNAKTMAYGNDDLRDAAGQMLHAKVLENNYQ